MSADTPTKEAVYDERINPLMAQILTLCKEHKISMLATFQLTTEADPEFDPDEGPLMCTSYVGCDGADPVIRQALRVIRRSQAVAITITGGMPDER